MNLSVNSNMYDFCKISTNFFEIDLRLLSKRQDRKIDFKKDVERAKRRGI